MTNEQKGNGQDREELGYGYDKSVDDLKVIGQNNRAKSNEKKMQKKRKREE